MYMRQGDSVLRSLLSVPQNLLAHSGTTLNSESKRQLSLSLSAHCNWSIQTLSSHASRVKDFRADLWTLEVFDVEVWDMVDLAQEIISEALSLTVEQNKDVESQADNQ